MKIHLGVEEKCGEWRFHPADNGSGFRPDYAERIFAPFKRLQVYEDVPGTGLGLVICRRVLERHGGRIWPERQPDHGARFGSR